MNKNDFYKSYIPNNHWLSKSMELAKLNNCGTYWYIKKMLVYYYYIFIKKKVGIKEINDITNNFNNYINSLDSNSRKDAESFFFEIDIRSKSSIITMNEMLSTSGFADDSDLLAAKKFYFSYIMNLLPQNGIKKVILDSVLSERNYFKGIAKARLLLKSKGITGEKEFNGLANDVHSFLRNHRQVLLLYGVLNSSPYNEENCSPTTMGLLMFNANFNELVLLMEIQKIKQVSRNPLVYYGEGFNRPRDRKFNPTADYSELLNDFNIRIHPYVFYLKFLCENGEITLDEYRYLIARTTDNDDDDAAMKFFGSTIEEIKKAIIKKDEIFIIPGSNNAGEPIPSEDFSKENKKYYMGLTKFAKDHDSSIFMFAQLVNRTTVSIFDKDKAEKIRDMYIDLTMYLDTKYEDLYKMVVEEQKKKYEAQSEHRKFAKGTVEHLDILEEWINYYNSADNEIIKRLLIGLIVTLNLSYDELYVNFPNLLKNCFGIKKKNNLLNELNNSTGKIILEPYTIPGKITIEMLKEESKKYEDIFNDFSLPRIRNTRLIDMYKIWLMQNNSNSLKCECCGIEYSSGHVHHIIPFNEESALGPDHYENLVYVCSNCHDSYHHPKKATDIPNFIEGINKNNLLKKTIKERIRDMKSDNVLYESCMDYAKRKKMI